jgi:hypothetical protein
MLYARREIANRCAKYPPFGAADDLSPLVGGGAQIGEFWALRIPKSEGLLTTDPVAAQWSLRWIWATWPRSPLPGDQDELSADVGRLGQGHSEDPTSPSKADDSRQPVQSGVQSHEGLTSTDEEGVAERGSLAPDC